jgi:putative hydrolase of the HAD superfamily
MAKVSALFWDIGGVLLSNGWDREARDAAAARFHLDPEELEGRHGRAAEAFETGRLDLDQYLTETVFDVPRPFSRAEFVSFMQSRSLPHAAALACARAFRADGRYLMATLNNESRELNEYRISTFGLREVFPLFLSSCYTGRRKPDADAYRFALEVTQRAPDEALLLDDRRENVDSAAELGLRTVWVQDPDHVREELASAGIVAG